MTVVLEHTENEISVVKLRKKIESQKIKQREDKYLYKTKMLHRPENPNSLKSLLIIEFYKYTNAVNNINKRFNVYM